MHTAAVPVRQALRASPTCLASSHAAMPRVLRACDLCQRLLRSDQVTCPQCSQGSQGHLLTSSDKLSKFRIIDRSVVLYDLKLGQAFKRNIYNATQLIQQTHEPINTKPYWYTIISVYDKIGWVLRVCCPPPAPIHSSSAALLFFAGPASLGF